MRPNYQLRELLLKQHVSIRDVYERQCDKEILATTAMYGPWTPAGEFDWPSYDNLVREVIRSESVPATNVDTTWAIYNDWELTKQLIWRTAEIATELSDYIAVDRPLLVAGLNTNSFEITADQVAGALRQQIAEIDAGLRERQLTERIRYMPVPDRRLYHADSATKVRVYRNIGQMISDFTDFGLVFFELDIGIPGFGSNFTVEEIEMILAETLAIQEYKSALITQKQRFSCIYDYCDDMIRINLVEKTAPERVQYSTGNDWFIALARYGKNIKKHGYLLGASQISPELFKLWRDFVRQARPCALAIEQDLQAAAKDFWTPGNVGIYRHYLGIFLAMTGKIRYPLPHPKTDSRFRVLAEDYFIPLRHAIRLNLLDRRDAKWIVRQMIPGCDSWSDEQIQKRIEWLG
ncbi:MAG TPA: hypothetical protein PKN04_12225 [bacterium]|jgi:hypothetical protein|nr:hypothetical protein [bacterium]HNT66539.1 hypothetical protein [bacterium]HOX86197.1 hypothetical protein [bacterium]HPG45589.1 hypothetical protein [bacterium]HPM97632.1 hypothetical protein [bacterium]